MARTADDVWELLAQLVEAQKETERRMQETDRRMQETDRRMQETDRRMQETDRRMQEYAEEAQRSRQETERTLKEYAEEAQRSRQETERTLKEYAEEAQRSRQETERILKEYAEEAQRSRQETEHQIQEVNQQIREVNKQIKEVNKQIGNLGGKWGLFVENMVAPACETLFLNRGIPVHRVSQRVKNRLEGETLEIDVLVTNEDHVLVVEVKSSLGVDNVKELIEDLKVFRQFFPEYNHKQLYGAVAGILIEEGADKYAYRQGLFVLAQAGENVAILNDDNFQPRVW